MPLPASLPLRARGAIAIALVALAPLAASAQQSSAEATPHYDLTVRLDPQTRTLAGRSTITLAPRTGATLVIGERFAIESIAIDGRTAQPERTVRDGLQRLRVPAAATRVEIAWRGTLDALDESLSHRETLGAARPVAAERGTFLPAPAAWYPAVAALDEHSTERSLERYRLTIDVPDAQRALVPGRLVAESSADGRYRATFDFPHPAQGITLVAGPYRVESREIAGRDGKPILLRTYFHAEIADLASGYLDSVAGYVQRYEREIGAYPFGLFSVVSSPTPTGFGFPAFTYLGVQVLRLPFIRDTSLGHEVLHNWWGNGVYVDYARGNWAEGLTTFMADYAYAEEKGLREAYHHRLDVLQAYSALAPEEDVPLARFTARSHGASQTIGYGKATMVFLMLRDRIGREAFERGVRFFWETHRFRAASWNDLRIAFEFTSGKALDGFFEEWIERAGVPRAAQEAWDPSLRVFRRLVRGEAPPLVRMVSLARDVGLVVAAPGAEDEARALASRLLEHPARPLAANDAARTVPTLLVIELDATLGATLDRLGVALPREPDAASGSARAVATWRNQQLVLVVSARDKAALAAITRPLPFYGRYGYVVFDGARAIERGVSPP